MSRQPSSDPRIDSSATLHVEHGLRLVTREGIGPALAFMEAVGVPRQVAVRVLASPAYSRSNERRAKSRGWAT